MKNLTKNYWVITSDNEIYFFSHYNDAMEYVENNIHPFDWLNSLILKRHGLNQFSIYGQYPIHTIKYFEKKVGKCTQ